MAGISSKALNETAENKIKFQGQQFASKEFADGSGLNMYEFRWRMHDPQVGRFWQADPLSDKYVHNGTYVFSENKVTSHLELEGLEAVPIPYNDPMQPIIDWGANVASTLANWGDKFSASVSGGVALVKNLFRSETASLYNEKYFGFEMNYSPNFSSFMSTLKTTNSSSTAPKAFSFSLNLIKSESLVSELKIGPGTLSNTVSIDNSGVTKSETKASGDLSIGRVPIEIATSITSTSKMEKNNSLQFGLNINPRQLIKLPGAGQISSKLLFGVGSSKSLYGSKSNNLSLNTETKLGDASGIKLTSTLQIEMKR